MNWNLILFSYNIKLGTKFLVLFRCQIEIEIEIEKKKRLKPLVLVWVTKNEIRPKYDFQN
jgi:hypothetical protein